MKHKFLPLLATALLTLAALAAISRYPLSRKVIVDLKEWDSGNGA